jgi:hypothetical protein
MSIWAEMGEKTSCRIIGDCMAPLIRQGDLLVIEHGKGSLRRGDILVFKKDENLLAHRLVYIEKTTAGELLYTKGDRSRYIDPPLFPDQIQGKVLEARGSNGHLNFTSRFWLLSSYLLAVLSHASAPDCRSGIFLWRALRVLRSIISPKLLAQRDVFFRALCATSRVSFLS